MRMLKVVLVLLFVLRTAAEAVVFPVKFKLVDINASKLIEFNDGEQVSYLYYDRKDEFAWEDEEEKQEVGFVTVPFGRMNMTTSIANFMDIFMVTNVRLQAEEENRFKKSEVVCKRYKKNNNSFAFFPQDF